MTAESAKSGWEPWSRYDEAGLARYVTPECRGFDLKLDRLAALASLSGRLQIAEAIYAELLSRKIRYSNERYHPSAVLQEIRTADEILAEHEGTCLDLATLFCSLCLHYELLPVLIVLEGHALAGIIVSHSLMDWNATRPGRALFDDGPLKDRAALQALVEKNVLVPIECTGFAAAESLTKGANPAFPETVRDSGATMSFAAARDAGAAQLKSSRGLVFALDIAVANYAWRIAPAPVTPLFETFREAGQGVERYIRVREFEALVNDHMRHFVGRRAVFERLDRHLKIPEFTSGYIVLQGEPGAGKSAIMSALVRTRGYLHHFNIATQNIRSSKTFLENMCAQIIVRYGLDYLRLPRDAGSNSGPMVALLSEAIQKNSGIPIVLLVDALDESEPAKADQGRNRLDLPKFLPDGAFIVVSTREQMDYQLDVNRRRDICLKEFRQENEHDIQEYISQFVQRRSEVMQERIRSWNLDEKNFTTALAERASGNFMYLVHVLDDIADGSLSKDSIDSIDQLPASLREYYQRHWRMMRDRNQARYTKLYEPVVCVLAAVLEPVTVSYIAEVTGLSEAQVKSVIADWRQFLREDPIPRSKPVYRIYHRSFQEFLAGEVGLERFQRMITSAATKKIPGL